MMRHFGIVVGATSALFLSGVGLASVAIASQQGGVDAGAGSEPGEVAGDAGMFPAGFPGAGSSKGGGKSDFPEFDSVVEGLEKVSSTTDGSKPLIELYVDRDEGKVLGVLPSGYENKLMLIAPTVSGGDPNAGVMGPTYYVYFKRYGKQIALLEPDFSVRTEGDAQAKSSIGDLYLGRVLSQTPIVSMAPGGRPVIDLSAVGLRGSTDFFGPYARLNASLAKVTKAKAFPENAIIEFEAPSASGSMMRITYDFGALEGTRGFKPRKADPRVGYFYNWHDDYAKPANRDVIDRYITRWNLEKADPSLRLSPPKEPIVWYIEHTTPVKFRRYVREGIEMWNDAYREIGIDGALVVYQQDEATGAHMDKDPEDARYNFFRWNASDQSYAIGPSRTNPLTGEILDADVVWHQGLTRSVRAMLENLSDDLTQEVFGTETLSWFEEHPEWDPRVRLRDGLGIAPADPRLTIHRETRGATGFEVDRTSGRRGAWTSGMMAEACHIGNRLSMDLHLGDAALSAGLIEAKDVDAEGNVAMLDGLPEEFIGPMIRYISAHEVGHCLGLQHNMAASTIRTLEEINSPGFEGPMVGSVMEYAGVNINPMKTEGRLGEVQGPYATEEVGPYDKWAIAFGYGDAKDREEILSRVAEPDLVWMSQVGIAVGSDPRNQTWDMGKDSLRFAKSRVAIVQDLRDRLVSDVVDKGEPWSEVRRRYQSTLSTHAQAMFIAANWIGSSYHHNDFKGDPEGRPAIEDVPAEKQREAASFIMDIAFEDDAFGLTPELVRHMGKEYWWDPTGMNELVADPSFTVHNMVSGVQATGLTLLMNPTTLRRVYDNEFRAGDDALTLPELLGSVSENVWRECREKSREIEISSFRRNLQREHAQRLIDLSVYGARSSSPALQAIGTLARAELREILKLAERSLKAEPDAYASAHLEDIRERIDGALEVSYIVTP